MDYNGGLTLAFQVKNRKATVDWYKKNLGWDLLYDVAEIGWCEVATHIKGVNVGFSEVEDPKPNGSLVPTFGVKDIEAARAKLESNKVRFDGPTREYPGMVRLATFYDPDGNPLMLFQSLGEH